MRLALFLTIILGTSTALAQGSDTCQIWARNRCETIVEQARPIARTTPIYPRFARERRQEGVIRVNVEVNDRGEVVLAEATEGPDLFRASAVHAARQWRFRPARVNRRSVRSSTILVFRFEL